MKGPAGAILPAFSRGGSYASAVGRFLGHARDWLLLAELRQSRRVFVRFPPHLSRISSAVTPPPQRDDFGFGRSTKGQSSTW